MKKVALVGIILLNVFVAGAQQHHIRKERKQIFILHDVQPKESLFSLSRLFNLSHKEIAAANHLDANAGLKTGQQIKIPLNKSNFIQSGSKKSGYEPVVYTIGKGDNLYQVSRNNNVKEAQLKKWNKLSKNIVKPGQELIVGYVKVSHTKVEERSEAVAVKKKQLIDTPKNDAVKDARPVLITTAETVKPVAATTVMEEKKDQPKASEEITHTKDTAPANENGMVFTGNTNDTEGYFAGQFAVNNATAQPKTMTGMAATFKSTSGWSDRKYYILINDIPAGTVVKLNANNKTIYAKVLESLPELKDNKDLLCRLSNAAASALGITDTKFVVEIYYTE